jgi:endoglucanase
VKQQASRFGWAIVSAAWLMTGAGSAEPAAAQECGSELFTPDPNPAAVEQLRDLRRSGERASAQLLQQLVDTPRAVWLPGSSPEAVEETARSVTGRAARTGGVPVLVAYNIPFRDCSGFSAGGATNTEGYLAWIDALARGIGQREAIVILEPDALGIIPFYHDLQGNAEWCQPAEADPATSADERFRQLQSALDRLLQQPRVHVYLDGTHSGWLGAGDSASRLVRAGVERAAGFFVNVSNYEPTPALEKYGSWISSCIAFAANAADGGWRLGHYEYCGSQYYPADPKDFSTWPATDAWYAANLGTALPSVHFVIDTSRNGQGHWQPPADTPSGDPQVWCNPPGRGAGERPTLHAGSELIDALLWIKVPGESDGQCNRWAAPGAPDPARGYADPAAGAWFPEVALELAQQANPPFPQHRRAPQR